MFVAVDDRSAGLLGVADPVKETTREAIGPGLLLSPMIAAAAMSFASVSMIGNSLRLRRIAW